MSRDWTAARAKCDAERACRYCKRWGRCQAAHVIGRKHDDSTGPVDPRDIVPLCRDCHTLYDLHTLDLLPVLTREEQARAVELVGLAAAARRICSSRGALDVLLTPEG